MTEKQEREKGQKASVVGVVQPDGTTKIVKAQAFEANVKNIENGKIPDKVSLGDLSKLFKPKRVIEIVTEDGSIITFGFKLIDPMTLLLTTGSPISWNETVEGLSSIADAADLQSIDELSEKEVEQRLKNIYSKEDLKQTLENFDAIKKLVIQAGITSTEITDEIYEMFEDRVINHLYSACTGGVTADNQAINTFREEVE